MAYRTWGRVLLAALGVGLLAGAGQLGFAYGLGVVRFARDFEQLSGQWTAHLAWVAWFAMLAAVAGALAGTWLARRDGLPESVGSRVAVAVAGGVGALAVSPLAMLPARVATIDSGDAVMIAGLSAALGALVGVFAAVAVLSLRVAGLNLGAVTVVVWVIALLSVAPSLGPEDPLPEVRLGVLDATWLGEGLAQRFAVIVMPAVALLVGAGIGALARWRGLPLIPVAVSGVVGPALLALAYLIAGPGSDADRYQAAPYWGALIAVAAGGLGSVLAAVARQLTSGDRETVGPPPRHGDHTAEVFPGHAGSGATADDTARTESFDAIGADKPAADDRAGRDRWGDDGPTGSLDSPTASTDLFGNRLPGRAESGDGLSGNPRTERATSSDDLFGNARSEPAAAGGDDLFGNSASRRDPVGSGSADRDQRDSGSRRARDLRDVERSAGSPPFHSPTPIAPPRQPEIVSPPPGPEPTPVRPFDRKPAAGPGDWRTDKTSQFDAASVPVVPAGPTTSSAKPDDVSRRPTSIRPQPATPGQVPRQAGESGLGPIDLPGQTGSGTTERAAGLSWSERPGATSRRDSADTGGGEMPDWRLAPPAWTPPPPITPGEPAAAPEAEVTPVPAAEAPPAKKRRGLFRRKEKTAAPEETAGGWVDVPTTPQSDTESPSGAGPGPDSRPTTGAAPGGGSWSGPDGRFDQGERDSTGPAPRGFGFGDLVSSRFGSDDRDKQPDEPTRGFDSAFGNAAESHTESAEPSSGRHGHDDESPSRRSWASRAQPAAAADEPGTPEQPRPARKSGRAERHLRSVDLGDNGDTGSWDIDDPAPTPAADEPKADEGAETRSAPSRGRFRRKGGNSDTTETRLDTASGGDKPDKPEPRRRGKSEKPIGEHDEEYVDWVTGLGAPEPVNERRRDETPRRSLRSTTRQKED